MFLLYFLLFIVTNRIHIFYSRSLLKGEKWYISVLIIDGRQSYIENTQITNKDLIVYLSILPLSLDV